jgi:ammonia channel protein AmtB
MLASTAFILLMTLPGRARSYAGVVQSKPVLSGDAMLLHHRHSNPVMVFRRLQPLLILKALNLVMGQVRVDPEAEIVGLDLAAHGERGYEL